jgi:ribonuclease E
MTSKKKDPWRSLAAQLGLASPEPVEPEETSVPSEVPASVPETTSELVVSPAAPFPVEPQVETLENAVEPTPVAPPKPAPVKKKRDHWGSVLGLLGLQSAPEVEEPEQAESAEAPSAESAPPVPPPSRTSPPPRGPRKGPSSGRGPDREASDRGGPDRGAASRERKPFGQLDDAPRRDETPRREEPAVDESGFEPPVIDSPEVIAEDTVRRERAREAFDSLFSDLPSTAREAGPSEDDLEKGLREFWNEELSAESKPLIPSLPPVHPRRERSWDVEDIEAETEREETDSPRGGETSRGGEKSESRDDPGRKRRRRRRGRGRGRGEGEGNVDRPATSRESTGPDEMDFEDAEDVSLDEPRSSRGTRSFREPEFGDDLDLDERPQRRAAEPSARRERGDGSRSEDDRNEEGGKRRRRRRRRPSSDVESTKEIESHDDDDFELSDDEADDAVAAYRGSDREGHKRIPTWLEAVNLLIDQNMSSRKSQPPQSNRGGGNRGGRGGRGRR